MNGTTICEIADVDPRATGAGDPESAVRLAGALCAGLDIARGQERAAARPIVSGGDGSPGSCPGDRCAACGTDLDDLDECPECDYPGETCYACPGSLNDLMVCTRCGLAN